MRVSRAGGALVSMDRTICISALTWKGAFIYILEKRPHMGSEKRLRPSKERNEDDRHLLILLIPISIVPRRNSAKSLKISPRTSGRTATASYPNRGYTHIYRATTARRRKKKKKRSPIKSRARLKRPRLWRESRILIFIPRCRALSR